jgi:hypothetical protein
MLGGAYAAAWVITARTLFARWRPARSPVGCAKECGASQGGSHVIPCYRQMRRDLTRVTVDYDHHAIAWAMLAALACPVLLLAAVVAFRPRELGAERKAREKCEHKEAEERKARLQAEISALEQAIKEADEQRDPGRIAIARRDGRIEDQPGCGAAPAGVAGPAGGPGGGGAGG